LEPVQDLPTRYEITANYTEASQYVGTASAYGYLADGTKYEVCRTTQYNLRPALNTSVLIVSPQSSCWLGAKKTIEEMEEEAKAHGFGSWVEFTGIFPPWLKFHNKVCVDWLGLNVDTWVGILGGGIDHLEGLGRLLSKAFEDVPPEAIDVVTSAIIRAMTVTTTLFVTNLIAATFTKVTPWYIATLLAYGFGGGLLIWSFYNFMDVYTAKAILFGVGLTLFSLTSGVISASILIKHLPSIILTEITGGEPIRLAAKSIVNELIAVALAQKFLYIFYFDPLMIPFVAVTLALAAWAIYLGLTKT
jgi:hypothetical protein